MRSYHLFPHFSSRRNAAQVFCFPPPPNWFSISPSCRFRNTVVVSFRDLLPPTLTPGLDNLIPLASGNHRYSHLRGIHVVPFPFPREASFSPPTVQQINAWYLLPAGFHVPNFSPTKFSPRFSPQTPQSGVEVSERAPPDLRTRGFQEPPFFVAPRL